MRTARALVAVLMGMAGSPGEGAGQDPMTWPEFRALDPAPPDHRIAWGDHPEARGELFLPAGAGPHPVVVLVHGGCWLSIADAGYVSHLARALTGAGRAVWSLEFRRIDQDGGAWPGILEDVAAGADHLRRLARDHPLDLDGVVAMGHSSGGHLALWLAARGGLPADGPGGPRLRGEDPLAVAAVVGVAAIADLDEFHGRRDRGCGADIVPRLLGGEPADVGGRLDLTSPARRLPLGVPQLLITGVLDTTVPPEHGRAWAALARAAGDPVRLLEVAGAGHFEPVAPWTAPFAALWPDVLAFLTTLRIPPGEPDA